VRVFVCVCVCVFVYVFERSELMCFSCVRSAGYQHHHETTFGFI